MEVDGRTVKIVDNLLDYYRDLELLLAVLVARYGDVHAGGFRLTITSEEMHQLMQFMDGEQPAVLRRYDERKAQHVLDVL